MIKVRGRLAANNMLLLRKAAIAGLGLAQLPSMLAADAMAAGQLVAVLDEFAGRPCRSMQCIQPPKYVPPKVSSSSC